MAYGSREGCGRHNQLHQINRHAQLLGADKESDPGNWQNPGLSWHQADGPLHHEVSIQPFSHPP
jgi:hypothetical protein